MPLCSQQLLLPAQPLATTGLLYVPKVLPVSGLIRRVVSEVWLSSLTPLRSVHVAARANNSSFFIAEWCPFTQVFHSLFKIETIVNKVTKNICAQVLMQI